MFVRRFMTSEQMLSSYGWKRTAPSQYKAILQAKNPGILVLNHGYFEGNSCELRILSR